MSADDGFMVVAILDENTTRPQAISVGLAMKKVCLRVFACLMCVRACRVMCVMSYVCVCVSQFSLTFLLLFFFLFSSPPQGKYLAEQKLVRAIRTREFKLSPQEGAKGSDIPFLIDGDPLDPTDIHVRVLQKRLHVFHMPE